MVPIIIASDTVVVCNGAVQVLAISRCDSDCTVLAAGDGGGVEAVELRSPFDNIWCPELFRVVLGNLRVAREDGADFCPGSAEIGGSVDSYSRLHSSEEVEESMMLDYAGVVDWYVALVWERVGSCVGEWTLCVSETEIEMTEQCQEECQK